MSAKQDTKVQGEGDRESARRYNEATRSFVERGGVGQADGSEVSSDEAEGAAREGRARAKEFDPEVHRDYAKPSSK